MHADGQIPPTGFTKDRLEAFSDGVIAIAITLLVLDLHSPHPIHGSLAQGLWDERATFAAYFVSFFSIGIFWINHHQFFQHVREVDYFLLIANLFLLMWVSLWPFTTKVLADNLHGAGAHEHGAAILYVCGFLALGITWGITYFHVRRAELIINKPSPEHEAYIQRRSYAGMAGYTIALIVALFSAVAALGICALVTLYYLTPVREEDPGLTTEA